jgi:Bacterial Ig domain
VGLKPRRARADEAVMRRPALVLSLLAGLLLAPAAAHAAQPGVNIANTGDLAEAVAAGAKTVRLFVPRSTSPAAYGPYAAVVHDARAANVGVIFVLNGDRDGATTDPADFATFADNFATAMKAAGGATAYEIWNEEDETLFWGAAVDAAHYSAILTAASPKIKAADHSAKVLLGPLTGNNYAFLQQVYAAGAGSAFDAVTVHTDTACLVEPPSSFYREDGKIARFSFLGFRTVHDVMAANGDGAKPIWMTELGWTSTTSTCARGMWAGQKPSGVSEAAQAANLKEAYHCLAGYPYVEQALWFTLRDSNGAGDELDHYGLEHVAGAHKPAWDAFHTVATQGDTLTGPCGDFDGPSLTVKSPTANAKYVAALTLSAVATDATGVARITFQADGKEIRNYTGADVGSGKLVNLEWQGSKKLALGNHTITVIALDPQGNTSQQTVQVTRVKTLPATLKTTIKLGKVKVGKGRKASISGRVIKKSTEGIAGKVRVYWQQKRGKKWKTIHSGLKPANKPFTFKQKLKRKGVWRVQVKYINVAPYKSSTALSKRFSVKH